MGRDSLTAVLLLAIDTSTTAITVALHNGDAVVAEQTTLDARAHAGHLAPNIQSALAQAGVGPSEVTGVVVGIGPGPFTGLRVGIVSGRTFAFALGLPVHGLCSLDALAHEAWLGGHRDRLLVATDARRKEVYAAELAGPVVSRAADLDESWRALPVAGRGPLLYPADLGRPADDGSEPSGIRPLPLDVSAGALADLAGRRLATGDELDGLEPLYLRRPDVATAPPTRKSTLG